MQKGWWTEEEDKIMIQAHKEVGNKWEEIARRLLYHTVNTTKNNWNATINLSRLPYILKAFQLEIWQ